MTDTNTKISDITEVTATEITGGYRYDAVRETGTIEVIRKKATRLYPRAYLYGVNICGGNKTGLARIFTFGKAPSSWATPIATFTIRVKAA